MREIKERFTCDRCGRTFTESDEEEARLHGYSTDPAHWLCPTCYMEERMKKTAKPKKTKLRWRSIFPPIICSCGNDVFALYSDGSYRCNKCGKRKELL